MLPLIRVDGYLICAKYAKCIPFDLLSSTQVDILKSIENQTSLSDGTYSPVLLPDGRRQSTPILLENQNVFSASLQISKPDESAPKPTTKINQMQGMYIILRYSTRVNDFPVHLHSKYLYSLLLLKNGMV